MTDSNLGVHDENSESNDVDDEFFPRKKLGGSTPSKSQKIADLNLDDGDDEDDDSLDDFLTTLRKKPDNSMRHPPRVTTDNPTPHESLKNHISFMNDLFKQKMGNFGSRPIA